MNVAEARDERQRRADPDGDVGAEIGEHGGAVGASDIAAEIKYPDAC